MDNNKLEWEKPQVLIVDLKEYENLIIANATSSCFGGSSCGAGCACYCSCTNIHIKVR